MSSFFPAIHPDELLYSAIARWRHLVSPVGRSSVPISLLGDESDARSHFSVDLPTRIDRFCSALPPVFEFSSEELIKRHTLFPICAPFLETDDRSTLLRTQKEDQANGSWLRRACAIVDINPRSVLKFCARCTIEDRETYGEAFWHRSHQPACVLSCHKHGDPLISSPISRLQAAKGNYVAIEEIRKSYYRVDHQTDFWGYQIAADTAWIIEHNNSLPGARRLSEFVTRAFRSASELRTKTAEVRRALLAFFGSNCLARLAISLETNSFDWVDHLVRRRSTLLPIQCYLAVCYLDGTSIQDALSGACSAVPVDRGPWPCVNPNCGYVGRKIITRFKQSNLRRRTLIFRCPECLETYTRNLPLIENADGTFQYTLTARSRGWHRQLLGLWGDHNLSVSDIAKLVARSRTTVQKAAADLRLPAKGARGFPKCALRRISTEMRIEKREQWLSVIEKNPSWNSTRIVAERPHLYRWLRRHDGTWLPGHMPENEPDLLRSFKRAPVDWLSRDREMATQIQVIADRMRRNYLAKPARITRQRLIEALGRRNLGGSKIRTRLPLTDASLSNEADTDVQFALRRIEWTAAYCRQTDRPINYRNFIKISGLYWSAKKSTDVFAMVREAVEKARSEVARLSGG